MTTICEQVAPLIKSKWVIYNLPRVTYLGGFDTPQTSNCILAKNYTSAIGFELNIQTPYVVLVPNKNISIPRVWKSMLIVKVRPDQTKVAWYASSVLF